MRADDLTSRLPEPPPPRTMHEPKSPDDNPELAQRNLVLALALFSLSLALFGGTFLVALVYLLLD
jgi:hypothetical protein